jgi:hypothetical protein
MPLRDSELMLKEVSEFLDALPKEPCDTPPATRYFCTVCERLNKPVQSRCKLYKSRMEEVGLSSASDHDMDLKEKGEAGSGGGSVEFKVVDDEGIGDEMPMFEIVKPSVDDSEPLEMDLLEKEAIEFELLEEDGEEISPDALEVEPIEVEEFDEGMEVEPLEVDVIEEEEEEEIPAAPKPKPKPKAKPKVKAKPKKKPAAVKPKAVPAPAPAPAPTQDLPRTKPVAAAPAPTVDRGIPKAPAPAPAAEQYMDFNEIFDGMSPEEIQAVERELIQTSTCTLCGAGLTNHNFCTQCGAKVVMTQTGVKTITREEAAGAAKPKPKPKPRRKVVPKKK